MPEPTKTYYREWSKGKNPIYTVAKVKGGVVVDAYVDQVGGNVRSSGGAEASVMGKTEEHIKSIGFVLWGEKP